MYYCLKEMKKKEKKAEFWSSKVQNFLQILTW